MLDAKLARSLIALLEEKQKFLEEIAAVTDEQTELIRGEDIQPLMSNIESRQHLIDAIDQIDAQVAATAGQMGEPDESPGWTGYRARLSEINAQTRKTLLQIDAQDKRNERAAMERLLEYQKGIQTVKTGAKGVTAYAAPPLNTEGVYFDKKN